MNTVNITFPTSLGDVKIYMDPRKKAIADKLLREFPHIMRNAYEKSAMAFGNRLAREAKTCLSRGMPPRGSGVSWPPHAESTVKRLGEHTLLYWSSQYYHAIKVRKRGKYIFVGVPSGLKKTRKDNYKSSNPLTLTKVANILEFGSGDGKIPPRPLWGPLWSSVGGKNNFKKVLVKELRKELRKYR